MQHDVDTIMRQLISCLRVSAEKERSDNLRPSGEAWGVGIGEKVNPRIYFTALGARISFWAMTQAFISSS